MNDVLPHFAKRNEAKRRSFKMPFGSVSRQMKCQWLFTQSQEKYSLAENAAKGLVRQPQS